MADRASVPTFPRSHVPTAALLLIALAGGCSSTQDAANTRPPEQIFGRSGMGPGEFNYPRAAAWSPAGLLYVVDKGGHLQAVAEDGRPQVGWMMPQIDAGKPVGLGFSSDGRLYVANTHYHEVVVFTPQGEVLTRFGSAGRGPGEFQLPTDVAVSRAGSVYVAEYGGNDRISRFTPDHTYEFSFNGAEQGGEALRRPQSIVIGPDERLWVADACNHRVVAFEPDGRVAAAFGARGTAPGEFYFPYSVDFLADGTLIVCEYGNNRVQRFTRDGRLLGAWGRPGRGPGELAYPWAASAGPRDRIFVVDSGNNRVQVIAKAALGG